MMISEFIERTGFKPTMEEYRKIEEDYYDYEGTKDDFCKDWLKNEGINKMAIERAAKIFELEKKVKEMNLQIEDMQIKLDGHSECMEHMRNERDSWHRRCKENYEKLKKVAKAIELFEEIKEEYL